MGKRLTSILAPFVIGVPLALSAGCRTTPEGDAFINFMGYVAAETTVREGIKKEMGHRDYREDNNDVQSINYKKKGLKVTEIEAINLDNNIRRSTEGIHGVDDLLQHVINFSLEGDINFPKQGYRINIFETYVVGNSSYRGKKIDNFILINSDEGWKKEEITKD